MRIIVNGVETPPFTVKKLRDTKTHEDIKEIIRTKKRQRQNSAN